MAISSKTKIERIAFALLVVWTINILFPLSALALTSGPAQPETQAFQAATTSDMVDLFTGDMKYNIPLLDVDGYPINLSYNAGPGMDDEASWVGLGWNLNVGAINRQLRGIADDLSGDEVVTTHYTKPKVTVGGRVSVRSEFLGKAVNGSFTLGIFSDNYTGIGAEIGVNAGLSFSLANSDRLTAGMGVGILSSTASGVDITPSISLSISDKAKGDITTRSGLSANLGYNTRSGLKDLTLGASFSVKGQQKETYSVYIPDVGMVNLQHVKAEGSANYSTSSSIVSYNTEPIIPKANITYSSRYGSFSFDLGIAALGGYLGGGGTGYKNVRSVLNEVQTNKEYGYLYAERGKNKSDAVMDFTREQDNPVIPELPNLAVPIQTPDLFTFTSQSGSGQFRLYRGGTGIYFDNETKDVSDVTTAGFDIGGGAIFHGGVTLFRQDASNTTRKWQGNNQYLAYGDFQDQLFSDPSKEHVVFRQVGERVRSDANMDSKLHGTTPLAVNIQGNTALASFNSNGTNYAVNDKIEKAARTYRSTEISYLTAEEAAKASHYKGIRNYASFDTLFTPSPTDTLAYSTSDRVLSYRKAHHISEITVTDTKGTRSVYGIPVYNLKQEEYTFAIGKNYSKFDKNQVKFTQSGARPYHLNGIDYYFHKEQQPAYATSFLLTEILSADYIDKGKPGITEDDAGTAIKFNYSRLPFAYKWRTPFPKSGDNGKNATINKGLLADPDDDKASIVYGEKELWYISSIETKTKIVYFITDNREDGLGVASWAGILDSSHKQKRLREIRIYSRANLSKPIKVVKFAYDYSLCPGTPNSGATGGGKLTLKKVWFEYGKTNKGKNHPYQFDYNKKGYDLKTDTTTTTKTISYASMSTDRWGTYKGLNQKGNLASNLENDEFPYTQQNDVAKIDTNAGLWSLSSITLPTGGQINIGYESDDYAYVQNRKAMVMVPFESFDNGSTNNLYGTQGIKLTVDVSTAPSDPGKRTQWFKDTYLNGSDYLYTKMLVRMASNQHPALNGEYDKDFVSTYCKVRSVTLSGSVATILFENASDGGVVDNPISFSAWQHVKLDYPRYAYPGFRNRVDDGTVSSTLDAAVTAIFSAISNLSELKENFYQKAKRQHWSSEVTPDKSFVRIVKFDGKKKGGGLRVKKIQITDDWDGMSGTDAPVGSYGQSYTYTTERNGQVISSGVAAYEPSIGNDENPMKMPVNYVQKVKGALNNFFNLEEPFGESMFPAPVVGYSKVTITDLNNGGEPDPAKRTGYLVSEFYTAKDFPVKVEVMPLRKNDIHSKNLFTLLNSDSHQENIFSQGYYLELNDMHGKGKAESVYNQSGALISSTHYYYNTTETAPGEFRLKNVVNVVKDDNVESAVIGRDIDFYTDFREQENINNGVTVNIGLDVIPLAIFPLFLPHDIPLKTNSDYKLFRSAAAVKVAQYYGLLQKVVKMENGSTITTENIAYDGLTGEPLVTKTQNEFKKDIYKVDIPAYWVYKGMGGAYQNSGMMIKGLQISSSKVSSPLSDVLQAGDELFDLDSDSTRYWVVDDGDGNKNLINKAGYVQGSVSNQHTFKIIRSGFRNQLMDKTSSLTCMENPIVSNKLVLDDLPGRSLKVLNASAATFGEDWYPERLKIELDTAYVPDTAYVWGKITLEDEGSSITTGCAYGYGSYYLRLYQSSSPTTPPNYSTAAHATFYEDIYVKDVQTIEETGAKSETGYSIPGFSDYVIIPTFTNGMIYQYCSGSPYSYSYATYFDDGSTEKYLGIGDVTDLPVITKKPVNPYLMGYRGNWRPLSSKVFQSQRENNSILSAKGANIAISGYITEFFSYWYRQNTPFQTWIKHTDSDNRWVTANTVTSYNRYGQELENRDALNRYSAASFDFNGQLPSAVASNAMYREIYNNSFEDLYFRSTHFDDKKNEVGLSYSGGLSSLLNAYTSHTGNYSLNLPTAGLEINTIVHNQIQDANPYLVLDSRKQFVVDNDKYFWGFEPSPSKKYVFSVWVKDDLTPVNKTKTIEVKANNSVIDLTCKAVVEKWKKMEGIIQLDTASALKITIKPKDATGVKIDDIRLHPFNSHMKSYVYDDKNYRLMAELDENAFATFYEYDDEGTLVRVKKETEKGIATLKESRSSYKKK